MSLATEFKAFVMRGNVVDLAVGIIIGAAFSAIVTSLVSDILTPPIGKLTGGVNFNELSIDLPGTMLDPKLKDKTPEELNKIPEGERNIPVKIAYGKFLQKLFDFLIIAFCLFMIIRVMNRLQKKEEAKPSELTLSEKLLIEIRDELKKAPADR
ncbi:large-conductance mechanosensitive channel protein MscL [Limnoglobus roseus]|uniref:Large-conductance mechanosensitive channel n=1 Tax=Limnoglobus roseus TaxID=2598579 RepID=A0A5C1A7A6_9BACT|nr:large-conductance mechanosensitive channel protein MscL [Limnoglobus roseus]QEL14590.1 large conductance mechanosensitive channel protein MscL [Limnoglobus roseus]